MRSWLPGIALLAALAVLAACNPQNPYSSTHNSPASRTGGSREVPIWRGRFPNNQVPESK